MKRATQFLLGLLAVTALIVCTMYSGEVVNAAEQQVPIDMSVTEAGSAVADEQLAVIVDYGDYYCQVAACDQTRRELRAERRAIRRANRYSGCDRGSSCDLDAGSCSSGFQIYQFQGCDTGVGSSCSGTEVITIQ